MLKLVVAFTGFVTISSSFAFVLDHQTKQPRPICTQGTHMVTPLEESIKRGECEPFAQGVGMITVTNNDGSSSRGTGMLIAPQVVLTAAHVVEDCLKSGVSCRFRLYIPTQFSGKVDVDIAIYQTLIPEAYLDLAHRIADLEAANEQLNLEKSKNLRATQEELISKNYQKISTYRKNIGQYDLAIVTLTGAIILPEYIQIYPGNIKTKFKGSPTVIGVAVNNIKDNKTGNPASTRSGIVRHMAIVSLDREFVKKDDPFVASFTLPSDYTPKCKVLHGEKKGIYPDQFYYLPETKPFLKGIAQPGDSGGPLIGKVNDSYYVIGVAQQINFTQCFDSESQQLKAGGTFFNLWTPTFNHQTWLKKNLANLAIGMYQHKLFSSK